MKSKIILAVCMFIATGLAAQGPTMNGLRTGFWTERSEGPNRNFLCKGNYKIVPLSQYDIIEVLNDRLMEVRYKKGSALLVFRGKYKENIAVKDSVWNTYDRAGTIRQQEYWSDGILHWSKEFDGKGLLLKEMVEDFDRDIRYEYTYTGSRLYKKEYYLPENKNKLVQEYYPNEPLRIPEANQHFFINFLTQPSARSTLHLQAKQALTITDISSGLSCVRFSDTSGQPLQFPVQIQPGSSIAVQIHVTPDPANYRSRDTIRINTSVSETPYLIFSSIFAVHLDVRTIKEITTVELSKLKDQVLIISPMGSVTDARIVSESGEQFWYPVEGITRINLSTFHPGRYRVGVFGCNDGGEFTLIITE